MLSKPLSFWVENLACDPTIICGELAGLCAAVNVARRGIRVVHDVFRLSRLATLVPPFSVFLLTASMLVVKAEDSATSSPVTFQSLLLDMKKPDLLATWPAPAYVTHQGSSYDRKSVSPSGSTGWFSNHDYSQFVRSETTAGRSEWVMMDADGPGCVDRFWTGGKRGTGTVRIYLDGATEPAIQGNLHDLLEGKDFIASPLAYVTAKDAGNMYLPIPYSKHCKITYEEADPKKPGGPPPARWYNIEYRTYPPQTAVQTFKKQDYTDQSALVTQVGQFLTDPWQTPPGAMVILNQCLEPGQEATLHLPDAQHAIRQLKFNMVGLAPDQIVAAHRAMVLIGHFDGEATIWCPVGDFFGSGVGVNLLKNWVCQVSADGQMSNRWVMPYQKSADLVLHNYGKQKVTVHLEAIVDTWTWNDRSMHFHSTFHDQTDIPTIPRSDWNYVTITGKGVYVGDTLSVFDPSVRWFGEGDEKIYVDGENFPSHFGTGTEDYYGSAWSFPQKYESSFSNLVLRPPKGYVGEFSVTRVRDLDELTFTKSLKLDMEIWHWASCNVDYSVATYWYAMPGATSTTQPQPESVVRPIKVGPYGQ